MAHPYSSIARLRLTPPGQQEVDSLLDRDHSGVVDTGFYDGTLERACNMIDGRLRGLYVVPFAAITDPTPCDGLISDLADYGTLFLLYRGENASSASAVEWAKEFNALMSEILTGKYVLNATKQTAESTAAAGSKVFDVENSFGLDADGNDNLDAY